MGINMKYYIISIAAIFISLGIGIFIGFNMDGQEIYLSQQKILVDSLENRFVEFKKEKEGLEQNIKDLNLEKEKQNIFIKNMFYEIVYNKLPESNIAIIETSDSYFYDDIDKTLKLSGASVPARIKYLDKIYNATEVELQEISNLLGVKLEKDGDFLELINKEIVDSLAFKSINNVLKLLIDHKYIEYDYDVSNPNVDNIIIAGGGEKDKDRKAEQSAASLIKGLQDQQFTVIGVERSDVEQSYIATFKSLNISTVDNVDSEMGKVSLIYLLAGAEGHYGEKSTADSLVPLTTVGSEEFE